MEEPILTVEQLENQREILAILFDGVRTVDPVKKKIIEYRDNKLVESEFKCYSSWKRNRICDNCISIRAIIDKKIHFKLEYGVGRVFLVAAVPVQDSDNTLALELSKDVTDSMLVENSSNTSDKFLQFIDSINRQQVQDSLTGLYNRRFIDERLPAEILNSINEGTPLSIIMADIDHFKKVNDTFGHLGGDYALEKFSELLTNCMSDKEGWSARYGGEEFLICLRNTAKEEADQFAELLRKRVEKSVFVYNGMSIRITSSFGVSTISSKSTISSENITPKITAEAFIKHSDNNLYAAKNAGRNRVVSGETDIFQD